MTLPTILRGSDLERAFGDWGVAVTYRQVAASFDPATQQVSETYTDTALTALAGPVPSAPLVGTAAPHLAEERQFFIRADTLPVARPAPSDRLFCDGTEYAIHEFALATGGLLYWLRGRRVGSG